MNKRLLSILILLFIFISCDQERDLPEPAEDEPIFNSLVAVLHPTAGNEVSGVITYSRDGENVRVVATVSGLEPESMHGFHIHEYGDCTADDGTSAGGHFDPFGMPHGAPTDEERHMGDKGNLLADEEGVATLDYTDEHIEMDGAFTILGRGVIIHAGEDDFETQPTGDAGARLACGVIGVAQPAQ